MKVRNGTLGSRVPTRQYLWVGISVLLGLGVISTIVDLTGVSTAQRLQALDTQQRVVIDAKSGAVSGADRPSAAEERPSEEFEVGEADAPPPTPADEDTATAPPTSTVVEEQEASDIPVDDTAPALATLPMHSDIPKVARTKESLLLAPAPEVSEITPQGALPKRGENDATPAMLYARNYTRKEDVATLHFVVLGLGFGSDTLALAQDLPPEVSFAFSPYGESLDQAIEAGRNNGHEAWIQLPLQSINYPQDDPGPLGLIATLAPNVFEARLNKSLVSMPGAVGVILPRDETLSGTAKIFDGLLKQLDKRGLLALSTQDRRSVKELTADKAIRKMLAQSDMVLDDVPNESVIKSKLAGLLDETKKRGQYVVVLHARPQTLILVKDWLKRITHEGVELAPLSAVLLRPAPMLTPEDVQDAPKEAGGHGGGEAKEEKPAEGGHGGGH